MAIASIGLAQPHERLSGLWRERDFLKLWAARSVSLFGSQVSVLALPLTAAVVLNASPFEVGLLRAVSFLPVLLLALPLGALIDRAPRRPVVLGADLGRAALLALLPILALAGALRIEHLYAVELLVGTLALAFDLALSAWYPSLISPQQLVDGNSKLELSGSAARVAGPSVASALVQTLGAPVAILADAVSFLASAALMSRIRASEPPRSATTVRQSLWSDMRVGVRFLFRHPALRMLAVSAALSNLFAYTQAAVLVLYVTRDLDLPAGAFGLLLTTFGGGGVLGALFAARVGGRLGIGGAMVVGSALMAMGDVVVALAGQPLPMPLVWLAFGQFVNGAGLPLFTVNAISLRQTLVPSDTLGRVVATSRWLTWGALPIGSVLGGALGESLGVHAALVVAAVGSSFVAVLLSRLNRATA